MPAISSRIDPSAITNVALDPAEITMPNPNRDPKRLVRMHLPEWGKQFAVRLKTNAQWIKRFLHGGG